MSIRASDDDRQRTVAALERHTGAGRLTLDEFAERPHRDLLALFAVAAVTLLVLGLFIALSR